MVHQPVGASGKIRICRNIEHGFRVCAIHRCCSCVKYKGVVSLSRCVASLNSYSSLRVRRDSGQVLMIVIHSAGLRYNDRKGKPRHLFRAVVVR